MREGKSNYEENKIKENLLTIKKNYQFRKVYKRGKRCYSKHLVMYYMPGEGNKNRYGFVVSKKVGKSARRSRVRRVISEAVRRMQQEIKICFDMVIVARKDAVNMTYHQCVSEIRQMMKKARIMKN